jgi:hypothetical protein
MPAPRTITVPDYAVIALDAHEEAALHHFRGNCHNGAICPVCLTEARHFTSGVKVASTDRALRAEVARSLTSDEALDLLRERLSR